MHARNFSLKISLEKNYFWKLIVCYSIKYSFIQLTLRKKLEKFSNKMFLIFILKKGMLSKKGEYKMNQN